MMSRANPVSRESRVKPPTVNIRPIIGWIRAWGATQARGAFAPYGYRSAREGLPSCGNDPVLGRLVDIGMHRQADHFPRKSLADRHAALDDGKMPVGFLAIERDRIIDRGRDALRLEGRRKTVAPAGRQADRVLRPDRGRAFGQLRDLRHVGQMLAIAPRDPIAGRDLIGENLELLDQHGRLDRVETAVGADAHALVPTRSLAMHAQAS